MFVHRISAILALTVLAMAAWVAISPAMAAEPELRPLVEAAKAAGDNAPDMAKMTLVEATSRYLQRIEGDLDFPFSVGIDLPLDAAPRSLSVALTAPMEETGRYVVVFDVALAKVTRRVRDMKEQQSRKIVTVNKIDNPAYLRAVKRLDSSSAKMERRPDNAKLAKQMDEAQQKLATTPQYLEQPVYGPYAYKLADTEGRKTLTVNYYVIDRLANRYMKSVFDVVENERFTVAYNVDPSDPSQSSFKNDVSTERQVLHWERAPVLIPLSQLLDHALAAGGPNRPIASTTALLAEIGQDRNRANARAVAEHFDDRPLNDPRFDSVVAIYSQSGMGSGFYVRSNIVMTNWHVVKNQPIVELRMYDKRETFGQVIAKDVLLDLALVKVQDRGRPVEFYQGKELFPGESVDAIGHPKRQLFTITRGIVSAIRKRTSDSNETKHAKDVLYIQTDSDINPGNSGGPLFKGNKVVGVNSSSAVQGWAVSADPKHPGPVSIPMPGLNFSVHYSEAKRFLDEAMRGE